MNKNKKKRGKKGKGETGSISNSSYNLIDDSSPSDESKTTERSTRQAKPTDSMILHQASLEAEQLLDELESMKVLLQSSSNDKETAPPYNESGKSEQVDISSASLSNHDDGSLEPPSSTEPPSQLLHQSQSEQSPLQIPTQNDDSEHLDKTTSEGVQDINETKPLDHAPQELLDQDHNAPLPLEPVAPVPLEDELPVLSEERNEEEVQSHPLVEEIQDEVVHEEVQVPEKVQENVESDKQEVQPLMSAEEIENNIHPLVHLEEEIEKRDQPLKLEGGENEQEVVDNPLQWDENHADLPRGDEPRDQEIFVPVQDLGKETHIRVDMPVDENAPLLPRKKSALDLSVIIPRTMSVDLLRGIAVLCMLIATNQGSPEFSYGIMKPSAWSGLKFGDFVYPMFLFILGVCIVLSQQTKTSRWKSIPRILGRAAGLFLLGFLFNLMKSSFKFSKVQIFGGLQQISFLYLICALFVVTFKDGLVVPRIAVLIFISFYQIFLYIFFVPGCGQGHTDDPNCTSTVYVDYKIFSHHISGNNDEYGFFCMLSAIGLVWFGVEVGLMLLKDFSKLWKLGIITVASVMLLTLGCILTIWVPNNRIIWSMSFLFITASLGILLAIFYPLLDLRWRGRRYAEIITRPIRWLGSNPLPIYFVLNAINILLSYNIHAWDDDVQVSVWHWIYSKLFLVWIENKEFASLFVSLVYTPPYFLLAWTLHRNNLHLRA